MSLNRSPLTHPALPRTVLLAAAALLSACTTTAHYGSDRIALKDPFEKINRKVYKFDRALDKAVLRPVAVVYTKVVPRLARRGIENGFRNLTEPETFVNAFLQAKPKVALHALARFVINSTLGAGGLGDPAAKWGIAPQREDFGQTFGVWGIGSGPYLMLPLLGPSTVRDAAGRGAAFAGGDPVEYGRTQLHLRWYVSYPITGLQLISLRARLLDSADKVLNGSADEYATVRSAYLQERRNELYDGSPPDEDDALSPANPTGSDATPFPGVTAKPAPRPADPPLNVDPGPATSAPPTIGAGTSDPKILASTLLNVDPGPVMSSPAATSATNLR